MSCCTHQGPRAARSVFRGGAAVIVHSSSCFVARMAPHGIHLVACKYICFDEKAISQLKCIFLYFSLFSKYGGTSRVASIARTFVLYFYCFVLLCAGVLPAVAFCACLLLCGRVIGAVHVCVFQLNTCCDAPVSYSNSISPPPPYQKRLQTSPADRSASHRPNETNALRR